MHRDRPRQTQGQPAAIPAWQEAGVAGGVRERWKDLVVRCARELKRSEKNTEKLYVAKGALTLQLARDSCNAGIHAIEVCVPHHCCNIVTLEADDGCSGIYTRSLLAERFSICGEKDDASSVKSDAKSSLAKRLSGKR